MADQQGAQLRSAEITKTLQMNINIDFFLHIRRDISLRTLRISRIYARREEQYIWSCELEKIVMFSNFDALCYIHLVGRRFDSTCSKNTIICLMNKTFI